MKLISRYAFGFPPSANTKHGVRFSARFDVNTTDMSDILARMPEIQKATSMLTIISEAPSGKSFLDTG